jgi:hypothetical protein
MVNISIWHFTLLRSIKTVDSSGLLDPWNILSFSFSLVYLYLLPSMRKLSRSKLIVGFIHKSITRPYFEFHRLTPFFIFLRNMMGLLCLGRLQEEKIHSFILILSLLPSFTHILINPWLVWLVHHDSWDHILNYGFTQLFVFLYEKTLNDPNCRIGEKWTQNSY